MKKDFARQLRKQLTPAEQKLWLHLRGKRFLGAKFRRQYVFGPYIVDFICLAKNLVIELDGGQHTEQEDYDAYRTAFINSHSFEVLRFWNTDVFNQINLVLETIYLQVGFD
jgi:very-short-patch-repair endonuclease